MENAPLQKLAQEERARQEQFHHRIFCCTSTACLSAGAGQTHATMEQAVTDCQCEKNEVEVVKTGCMGLCSRGPLVRVETKGKEPVLYGEVTSDTARQIVSRHISLNETEDIDNQIIPWDLPFFTKQVKVVLSQTGQANPEKLEDYLAHGGYQALAKGRLNRYAMRSCAAVCGDAAGQVFPPEQNGISPARKMRPRNILS
jgi:bidirectional [NiFe] hydrogenase diaphorase subunit